MKMMVRLKFCLLSLLVTSSVVLAGNSETVAERIDVRLVTCSELISLPKEDQGYVLVMLFGYTLAEKREPIQTVHSIEKKMNTAFKQCQEAPNSTVLSIMLNTAP